MVARSIFARRKEAERFGFGGGNVENRDMKLRREEGSTFSDVMTFLQHLLYSEKNRKRSNIANKLNIDQMMQPPSLAGQRALPHNNPPTDTRAGVQVVGRVKRDDQCITHLLLHPSPKVESAHVAVVVGIPDGSQLFVTLLQTT